MMASVDAQPEGLTIDELAALTGTTTRNIRSFQTRGLMGRPVLHGRTGLYSPGHLDRLTVILRLQSEGFSLHSLSVLFEAHEHGESLATLLGLTDGGAAHHGEVDEAELYGFVELQRRTRRAAHRGGPMLSIVPTTVWNETAAS
jgi:DNA-binding transcriptional MerR regulator